MYARAFQCRQPERSIKYIFEIHVVRNVINVESVDFGEPGEPGEPREPGVGYIAQEPRGMTGILTGRRHVQIDVPQDVPVNNRG